MADCPDFITYPGNDRHVRAIDFREETVDSAHHQSNCLYLRRCADALHQLEPAQKFAVATVAALDRADQLCHVRVPPFNGAVRNLILTPVERSSDH